METHVRRYGLPLILLLAGGGVTLGLTALLLGLVGYPVASTLGMGVGVGVAVFLDRRWLGPTAQAVREGLEYGAWTAFGWAIAQLILSIW